MSDKRFFDTNVLLYAYSLDPIILARVERSRNCVANGMDGS